MAARSVGRCPRCRGTAPSPRTRVRRAASPVHLRERRRGERLLVERREHAPSGRPSSRSTTSRLQRTGCAGTASWHCFSMLTNSGGNTSLRVASTWHILMFTPRSSSASREDLRAAARSCGDSPLLLRAVFRCRVARSRHLVHPLHGAAVPAARACDTRVSRICRGSVQAAASNPVRGARPPCASASNPRAAACPPGRPLIDADRAAQCPALHARAASSSTRRAWCIMRRPRCARDRAAIFRPERARAASVRPCAGTRHAAIHRADVTDHRAGLLRPGRDLGIGQQPLAPLERLRGEHLDHVHLTIMPSIR